MSAKDIVLKAITRQQADVIVKKYHYSGKTVNNSQLSIGVFYNGNLEGAMQFGPSLDKRKTLNLVKGTPWNGCLELNRMAFSDKLPRNSESRALAIAMRMIKKHAPHVQWIISFADGTQCGDGTIYRASGFVLTAIKKNNQIWTAPSGETFSRTSLTDNCSKEQQAKAKQIVSRTTMTKGNHVLENGAASMKLYESQGWKPLQGFQLRYVYFLDPTAKDRLTVPILPFSAIEEHGASMYKGKTIKRPKEHVSKPMESGRCDSDPDAPVSSN